MITNAELSILSLVAEQPRHGYEIEQVIEARGMRAWTDLAFSSIYYVLKKLEQRALITSASEPAAGRGPARRVYRLTPAGQQAWQAAALEALSDPQPCHTALQLGLANLPALPPDQVRGALDQYLERLEARAAELKQQREAQRPLPPHVEAMFDYSLTMMAAEGGWVQNLRQQMLGEPPESIQGEIK